MLPDKLKVGISIDPDADYGYPSSRPRRTGERASYNISEMAVSEGSELVVDGRGLSLQGYGRAFFSARR